MELYVFFSYPNKKEKWYWRALSWIIAFFSGGNYSHTGVIIKLDENKFILADQNYPKSRYIEYNKNQLIKHFEVSTVYTFKIIANQKYLKEIDDNLKKQVGKKYSIWQLVYIMFRAMIIPSLLGIPQFMKKHIKSIRNEYVCSEYTNNFVFTPLEGKTGIYVYKWLTNLEKDMVSPTYQYNVIHNYIDVCEDKKVDCEFEKIDLIPEQ